MAQTRSRTIYGVPMSPEEKGELFELAEMLGMTPPQVIRGLVRRELLKVKALFAQGHMPLGLSPLPLAPQAAPQAPPAPSRPSPGLWRVLAQSNEGTIRVRIDEQNRDRRASLSTRRPRLLTLPDSLLEELEKDQRVVILKKERA